LQGLNSNATADRKRDATLGDIFRRDGWRSKARSGATRSSVPVPTTL
jgi:hypothetical protein